MKPEGAVRRAFLFYTCIMATKMDKKRRHSPRSTRAATPANAASATSPDALSDRAREKIFQALPEILDALIDKAKAGSYLHANFLFVFAGLDGMEDEEDAEQGESLAELLLRKLDEGETSHQENGVRVSSENGTAHAS